MGGPDTVRHYYSGSVAGPLDAKKTKMKQDFYPFNLLLCKKGHLTVNIIIYYHHFVVNSVFCIPWASGIAIKSQIG